MSWRARSQVRSSQVALQDGQKWRWLAAALAALSHRVQEEALLLDLDDNGAADGLS